jgi:hypothetical protein
MKSSHLPVHRLHWHWEPALALLAAAGGYGLVSNDLRIGPVWMLPAAVVILLVPLTLARRRGFHLLSRRLAFVLILIAMVAVGSSVISLVVQLFRGSGIPPKSLLRDAALLWLGNVVVFGLWYWELDGGGPSVRFHRGYAPTDLLFPQNQQGGALAEGWSPTFVDYLFVAFNASTAFSPTDTLVLSARTKLLMMIQSLSSIVMLAILAARAINTLQ